MKMRMFGILSVMMVSMFAVGCNAPSVGCAIQDGVISTMVPAIASGLQCSNQAAITTSLTELGAKAGLCTAPATDKSILGGACTTVANLLIQSFATAPIPAAWGCTAVNATSQLEKVVDSACGLLAPAPVASPSPAAVLKAAKVVHPVKK